MINQEQTIPCPVCSTKIPFNPQQLLQGVKFACPQCSSAIGLSDNSKDTVKESMEKFEELKKKSLRGK